MVITVSDVRSYLNDISADEVSDSTINQQLTLAQFVVDNEASKEATDSDRDKAVLTYAGYLTYLAYAESVERGLSGLPTPMMAHLDRLKEIAETMLAYISLGLSKATLKQKIAMATQGLIKMPKALIDMERSDWI